MCNHPWKQRSSTALKESTGLSLIYKSLILRAYTYSFLNFLHHRRIYESMEYSLKSMHSLARGNNHYLSRTPPQKLLYSLLASPSLLKTQGFFSVQKVSL